uniref:Uncharacterized protein n=1 Tax=Anguilla anguilla TaxID=7936 RepID=A0A0E9RJ56_ANGAN
MTLPSAPDLAVCADGPWDTPVQIWD